MFTSVHTYPDLSVAQVDILAAILREGLAPISGCLDGTSPDRICFLIYRVAREVFTRPEPTASALYS